MSLTPADVHNVAFSKPPIGKRGYNEDEVDAFLDLVETELARLIEDNNELRQQMEQLDAELESTRSELDSAKSAPPMREEPSRRLAPVPPPQSAMEQTQAHSMVGDSAEPNVQAAKVLGLAQEMADRLTAEAKTESDGMLAEARTRVDTMLNDARTRAETLERQARDKATTLERESQRKYTETMNSLNSEKSGLGKKIEELRTIEREYRTRLRGFLESQLRELDDRGSAAPASASSNSGQSSGSSSGGQGYSFGPRAEAG
jgi:DivIVA domain-containing protein